MPLVKVKGKGQTTLPTTLREHFVLQEGDYLKAEAVPAGILLTPVTIAERPLVPAHDVALCATPGASNLPSVEERKQP
jgi:bifunctional DNA-binding transcriptional regulator/antitoxin component of YhaV-PrlF toxin-antitoxin module